MLTATCTNVGEKAMQKRARDFLIGLFFSLLILQQAYLRFWLFQHFCSETIQGLFYGYDLIVWICQFTVYGATKVQVPPNFI